jgi:hypothetical protein
MIYFPVTKQEKSIGSSIGEGLSALVEGQTQHLLKRRQVKETQAFLEGLGEDPAKAAQIAQGDPQLIQQYIKGKYGKSQIQQNFGGPPEQDKSYKEAINIASGRAPIPAKQQQRAPFQASPKLQKLQQFNQNQPKDPEMAAINALKASPYAELLNRLNPQQQNGFGQPQQPSALDRINAVPGQQLAQNLQRDLQQEEQQKYQNQEAPKNRKLTAADIKWQDLSPKQTEYVNKVLSNTEAQERKEKQLKAHYAKKEELLAQKETKPYWDSILKVEKASEENDLRLDKIKKLVKNGKLPNAALWSFLTKIEDTSIGTLATAGAGIGALAGVAGGPISVATVPAGATTGALIGGAIGALASPLAGAAKSLIRATSPDIEEFEKTSNDFVKNAKQYFGSRLTDADLRAFMSTVPTLMQTDAGKLKVAENLQEFNTLARSEAKIAREIVRKNKGKRPFDIELQVQERLGPQKDRLARKFKGEEEVA